MPAVSDQISAYMTLAHALFPPCDFYLLTLAVCGAVPLVPIPAGE